MGLLYIPFGFRRSDVEALLEQRREAHARAMAAARARLQALREENGELRRYADLLRSEIRSLEQEEERLRLEVAAGASPPEPEPAEAPAPPDPHAARLERLRRQIHHIETLHRRITAGVMALIGPYLKRPGRRPLHADRGKEERHV